MLRLVICVVRAGRSRLKVELATDQVRLADTQATTSQAEQYLTLAWRYDQCDEVADVIILTVVEKIVIRKSIRLAKDDTPSG